MKKMKTIYFSLLCMAICWLRQGVVQGYHQHGIPKTFHGSLPTFTGDCDAEKRFRYMNGNCNNLQYPLWGSAIIALERALPSVYEDGESTPRVKGVGGDLLPSPREVSLKCHFRRNDTEGISLMYMHWGQFVDHDISLTPMVSDPCPCDSTSSECFPIELNDDDFFTTRDCLEVQRSKGVSATDSHNTTEPVRQQLNILTAYIDASNVYGNSDEEITSLLGSKVFEMRTSSDDEGNIFMPPIRSLPKCRPGKGKFCFVGGDPRNNVQPGLSGLHTLFVREHNRIAEILSSNKHWSTERIFEEARKIVGAEMQIITYGEYLPLLFGPELMKQYDLELSHYEYNASLTANVFNSFATAAFRFGHSQIPEDLELPDDQTIAFKNAYFFPDPVTESFDQIFSHSGVQESTSSDRFFAHSVTNHLFQRADGDGSDLVALNIQRGRDHGLPSFNEYRKWCGLEPMTSLLDLYPDDNVAAAVYSSIEDVDLFSGAMVETPLEGALVGPTFACILGRQFQRLKSGDRFFYLTDDETVGFTSAQKKQLKKVTLSGVICDNTEIKKIQPNIFLPENPTTNPSTECEFLPHLRLNPWAPAEIVEDLEDLL